MDVINNIVHLIKSDFIIDKRSKLTFGNTILYMLNTIILCYYTLKESNIRIWHILFWIILLFAAINYTSKNNDYQNTYRYTDIIAKPIPLILSKLIYNTIIITILGIIESLFFILLTDNIKSYILFLIIVILGAICLSSVLTFLSAIANKTKSNIGLVTILGCPMLLPTILTLIKITIELNEGMVNISSFISVIFICILAITSIIVLFPYIWRE
ncbi:MAG: heme exporter protein CcmB [Solitalea-like symbiont of Acarus siro]